MKLLRSFLIVYLLILSPACALPYINLENPSTYLLKKDISIDEAINNPSFSKVNLQYSDMRNLDNRNFWIKIPMSNNNVQQLEKRGALENLCQSGSITHTQGLKDGISDRHRGAITTNTRG